MLVMGGKVLRDDSLLLHSIAGCAGGGGGVGNEKVVHVVLNRGVAAENRNPQPTMQRPLPTSQQPVPGAVPTNMDTMILPRLPSPSLASVQAPVPISPAATQGVACPSPAPSHPLPLRPQQLQDEAAKADASAPATQPATAAATATASAAATERRTPSDGVVGTGRDAIRVEIDWRDCDDSDHEADEGEDEEEPFEMLVATGKQSQTSACQ